MSMRSFRLFCLSLFLVVGVMFTPAVVLADLPEAINKIKAAAFKKYPGLSLKSYEARAAWVAKAMCQKIIPQASSEASLDRIKAAFSKAVDADVRNVQQVKDIQAALDSNTIKGKPLPRELRIKLAAEYSKRTLLARARARVYGCINARRKELTTGGSARVVEGLDPHVKRPPPGPAQTFRETNDSSRAPGPRQDASEDATGNSEPEPAPADETANTTDETSPPPNLDPGSPSPFPAGSAYPYDLSDPACPDLQEMANKPVYSRPRNGKWDLKDQDKLAEVLSTCKDKRSDVYYTFCTCELPAIETDAEGNEKPLPSQNFSPCYDGNSAVSAASRFESYLKARHAAGLTNPYKIIIVPYPAETPHSERPGEWLPKCS